ncbi:MAG: hypothetical protein LBP98_09800, partial [Tannerella sp.]|nr:hypothetical protein [Tannerella sp.]
MKGRRSKRAVGVLFCLFVLLLPGWQLNAQRTGEWRSWPSTWQTDGVAETPRQVFAIANGTLYSY